MVGVAAVVLPLLFVGALAYLLSSWINTMKSSGGYQQALAMVRADPAAMEALGTPIDDGWSPTGHVESGGSTGGTSDLAIPVSGPNGGGTLYVNATSVMGEWQFTRLVLKVKSTGEEIDLLQTAP